MKSLKSVAVLRRRLHRAGERYALLAARHREALAVADTILAEQYQTGREMQRLGAEVYALERKR